MKKLINDPTQVVPEMLDGLVALHPGLVRLPDHAVVLRADAATARAQQVALLSGGGSGHEPAHAGYVGQGMLSAAIVGDVFTSPTPDAVLAALHAVTGPPGAVLIVKNYTGDRLNFGLAAEHARASGLKVEIVTVADDVALLGSATHAGPRGIAGTVLIHKIAGAAAAAGKSLAEVAAVARSAAQAVSTMGVALSPAIVPAAGKPTFTLGENEIELGLGIHGEAGVCRTALQSATHVVAELLGTIVERAQLGRGERVGLLVNNLGGTTHMELGIVAREALLWLEHRGLHANRAYAGTFLTALEMAGVSLSLLRLDDARIAALDAPTTAPFWPALVMHQPPKPSGAWRPLSATPTTARIPLPPPSTPQGQTLKRALELVCAALVADAPRLTELDQAVGDGDLGISLERGAHAIEQALPTYPLDDPPAALRAVAQTLQRSLGGTSGPLYAVFLLRAAAALHASPSRPPDARAWAASFRAGVDAMAELGNAHPGDRTMLDALHPAAAALQAALTTTEAPIADAFAACLAAAEHGSQATASMLPRRGRSSYLGERAIGHPDPGAAAVVTWLRALTPLWGAQ